MRLFLAFLVAALAVGGALAIYNARETTSHTTYYPAYDPPPAPEGREWASPYPPATPETSKTFYFQRRPTWAGPVALVLVIAGIGGGVAIAASGRR